MFGKIIIRHQFLYLIIGLVQCLNKLFEVLFVEKNFVLFKNEGSIVIESLFTFCYCQVKIVRPGCLKIKKISPFSSSDTLSKDFAAVVSLFHLYSEFGPNDTLFFPNANQMNSTYLNKYLNIAGSLQ